MRIQHIKDSVYAHKTKDYVFFIFWGVYLADDHKYYAQTFAYRFDGEKDEAFIKGWKYIQDMLALNEAYEYENQFDTTSNIVKKYQIFAVAPYEQELDPYQKERFDKYVPKN